MYFTVPIVSEMHYDLRINFFFILAMAGDATGVAKMKSGEFFLSVKILRFVYLGWPTPWI